MKTGGLIASILLVVLFAISFSGAVTLTVCSFGCNHTSIQSAIGNASSGDTIDVSSGTYTEDLVINSTQTNLDIVGAGSSTTTIKGISNVPILSFPLAIPNIEILADGVKLHGFTIEGPDYESGKYSSGLVIGGKNVEIYSNAFKTPGAANSDEISQTIQTYHKLAIPGVVISGLNIHDNSFISLAGSIAGYEAIWINLDEGIGMINIQNNQFSGDVFRAITTERSKTNIKNNVISTTLAPNTPGLGAWQGINIGGANNGSISTISVVNNTVNGTSSGNGFNYGIKLGYDATSAFSSVSLINNTIEMAGIAGIWAKYSANGIVANYNNLAGNPLGVKNDDASTFNAENNWWGACNGPGPIGSGSGVGVSVNVSYTPWLGACISNKSISSSCIFLNNDVTLYANVSSLKCIGNVKFGVLIGGVWKNYTGSKVSSGNPGNYSVLLKSGNFTGSQIVNWTVFADDCYGHESRDGLENFYINSITSLSVNPSIPDGLAGWFVTEPFFTLNNPDALQIFYRWDSAAQFNYTSPFNLSNIPNLPPETAGILDLRWWSNTSCGLENVQNKTFHIDLTTPRIEQQTPANGSVTYNRGPVISAVLNEVYGSNSGINEASIVMKVDNVSVSVVKTALPSFKLRVSHTPTGNLTEAVHIVELLGQDNSGRNFSYSWQFSINTSTAFNLNVSSPENKDYNDKNVLFNIDTTNSVSKIEYNDSSRWKTLCTNCNGYNKKVSLGEGNHTIIIRASDSVGNSQEKEIKLFIDSRVPRVISIKPESRKIVNGSFFGVSYDEANLKETKLIYGNSTLQITNVFSCVTGRTSCNKSINLSVFNGQYIDFYFNLSDGLNTGVSRTNRIFVDTSIPVISINNPANSLSYVSPVLFNITLNEKAKVEYIDLSSFSPKWKNLCADCSSFSGKKSFSLGIHNIDIRASDKAGNSIVESRSFNVV